MTPKPDDVLVLGSGGPDSLIAFLYERAQCGPGSVYYGQIVLPTWASEVELAAVDAIVRNGLFGPFKNSPVLRLGSLTCVREKEDAEVPLRNLLMLTAAASLGFSDIVIAVQQDEMAVPDRTSEFLADTEIFLSRLCNRALKIRTPFKDMDKTDMVGWALSRPGGQENFRNRELLEASWSCYRPIRTSASDAYESSTHRTPFMHCGDCPACVRRFIAFKPFGVQTSYMVPVNPDFSLAASKYLSAAREGKYSPKRCKRILDALAVSESSNG